MDTLSRKHRLRQQQQLQRVKDQQKYQLEKQQLEVEYQVVSSRKHQVASNGVKQAEDDEEFRVYKVVEVVRGGGGERPPAVVPSQSGTTKLQQAASNKRKTSSGKPNKSNAISGPNNGPRTQMVANGGNNNNKRGSSVHRLSSSSSSSLWPTSASSNGHLFGDNDDDDEDDDEQDEEDEEEEDDDDDVGGDDSGEEFAIQVSSAANCRHQLSQQGQRRSQQQQQQQKGYSHRCSTDSSKSIGDAGSSSSSGFLSSEGGSSRPHSIRSSGGGRLLDELDKLMNAGKVSPSDDSYLSLATDAATPVADSTLIRHRELDYSQVCRDEFSSFIELAPPVGSHLRPQKVGPVLVGVHVDESSSPMEYSNWSQIECHRHPTGSLSPLSKPSDNQLSRLLDSHLSRVDCLLRLSRGDCTVSMDEAFGSLDDILEEVSQELRTPIEFGPLQQRLSMEMSQQSETIELADAELDQLDERELERRCSVQVTSGWKNVLASATFQPPAHLELDWFGCSDSSSSADGLASRRGGGGGGSDELSQSHESLERSLIERLLDSRSRQEAKLVKTIVRRHLSDFLERYLEFQSALKANIEVASDWHQNWLFAWKRPVCSLEDEENPMTGATDDAQQAKRTKLSPEHSADLLRYSTLILSNTKFGRAKVSQPPTLDDEATNFSKNLATFYEAQQDIMSELETVERESRGQINLCNLLALNDTCDKENNSVIDGGNQPSGTSKRHLLVKYATSYVPSSQAHHQFVAYGHLFESSLLRMNPNRKGTMVERRILDKLRDLLVNPTRPKSQHDFSPKFFGAEDRVRFTISLTNVELVNQLPVVQFCAKISGRLPVRVRWFRLTNSKRQHQPDEVELSDPSRLPAHVRRSSLRQFTMSSTATSYQDQTRKWPLDMQATSELIYQNEWSSWFRFRRFHNELLFEIREANLEQDYGQVYRCLVENCCSQSECTFALTRATKTEAENGNEKVDENNNKRPRKENNKAILRTWSQRTLRQRAPETMRAPAATESEEAARSSWQQTIDRRSSVVAAEAEDKFGHHFPYHPANLLKRLEENKFSPLKCRPNVGGRPDPELDSDFAEPHLPDRSKVERQKNPPVETRLHSEVEPQHWRQPTAPTTTETSAHQQPPKPRLRLNKPPAPPEQQVSRSGDHQQEQVAANWAPEVEPERPKVAPKPSPLDAAPTDAKASVKSLISRFSVA